MESARGGEGEHALVKSLHRLWIVLFVLGLCGAVPAGHRDASVQILESVSAVQDPGRLEAWLNELAFCPVDLQENGKEDEWSKDVGVGAMYFSQQAVNRLASSAGIGFDESLALPERLVHVQELMESGDESARQVYQTIGVYLGYAMAGYREFYDFRDLLLLGRVSSGKGGEIIVERARAVLAAEFPELGLNIHLPDDNFRRVGQSIAAASLPHVLMSQPASQLQS